MGDPYQIAGRILATIQLVPIEGIGVSEAVPELAVAEPTDS
jgi:hypothetical protein